MASVQLMKKDSIIDDLERLHQRIAERAYAFFRDRNGADADAFGDWLMAEREVVWKPAIEVREQDGAFVVHAALPGVDAKNIEVDVTPQDVVIKADTEHVHAKDDGPVHRCEFASGEVFRSIELPKPIDTAKVKADYQNGMLRITAPIAAEAQARRVAVTTA
jgi:HSP20 family protein